MAKAKLQKINATGSTMVSADVKRNQEYVLILVTTCNDQGTKTLAAGGDLNYSKFAIRGAMVIDGPEAQDLKDRVINSGQAHDLDALTGDDG